MVPWKEFLLEFARAGNLTLGGGAPMIAEMQRRLMLERRWVPAEEFGFFYGISRLTPGTNVLAFIAALATRIHGWQGGVAAVLAGSLPAGIVIWLMTISFERWSANAWVAAGMMGAMAGVVALIVFSAWQLLQPMAKWKSAWILAVAGLVLGGWNLASPLVILAVGAAAGALLLQE